MIAFMVKGKFLSTVYELTKVYLSIVTNWATGSGTAINKSKIELVLFTRRYKIRQAPLPLMGIIRLQRFDFIQDLFVHKVAKPNSGVTFSIYIPYVNVRERWVERKS